MDSPCCRFHIKTSVPVASWFRIPESRELRNGRTYTIKRPILSSQSRSTHLNPVIMSILILTMPPSAEHPRNYEHRTLRAHETHKATGPPFTLKDTTWLRGQSIMRGTLSSPRGTFDVVAKLGTSTDIIDALKKELSFYEKLHHLQGEYIPKCFGYFFSPSDAQAFGCLVLGYSGKPIRSIYDTQGDIPLTLRCAFRLWSIIFMTYR
jgi:hypothetical protein